MRKKKSNLLLDGRNHTIHVLVVVGGSRYSEIKLGTRKLAQAQRLLTKEQFTRNKNV